MTTLPNVLMIHTGGTLMMRPGDDNHTLEPDVYARDLLAELPVLRSIASIDTRILFNLDSGDMVPSHWVEIARSIHASLDDYDGIVVITGTDTMAFTASALSFLLPGLDRPVVLTGAQRPIFDFRTDARSNLVDAFHIATLPVAEVGIAFGHKFLRGCRSTKMDAWGLDAFDSPLCQPLVELGLGVMIAPHVLPARAAGAFDPRIDPQVLCLRVFPGLDSSLIDHALQAGVHGIVLEAFGVGNVPLANGSLIPSIARATDQDVPVIIVSQCPRGGVDLGRYPGSAAAQQAGAISGGDMTVEAAITKLMTLLGRAPEQRRRAHVVNGFRRALLGEMSADLPYA
jgi:L-asparaginase